MRNYKKWVLFTKYSNLEFKDVYVPIEMKKNKGVSDFLEFRGDIEIIGMCPCVDEGVTLRIYWRYKE